MIVVTRHRCTHYEDRQTFELGVSVLDSLFQVIELTIPVRFPVSYTLVPCAVHFGVASRMFSGAVDKNEDR